MHSEWRSVCSIYDRPNPQIVPHNPQTNVCFRCDVCLPPIPCQFSIFLSRSLKLIMSLRFSVQCIKVPPLHIFDSPINLVLKEADDLKGTFFSSKNHYPSHRIIIYAALWLVGWIGTDGHINLNAYVYEWFTRVCSWSGKKMHALINVRRQVLFFCSFI